MPTTPPSPSRPLPARGLSKRWRWLLAVCCALALHAVVGVLERSPVRRAPVIANAAAATTIELELKSERAPRVVVAPPAPQQAPRQPKREVPPERTVDERVVAEPGPVVEEPVVVDETPSFAPRRLPEPAIAGVPSVDDTSARIKGFVAQSQADAGAPDFYALTPGDAGSLVYESKELKGVIAADGSVTFEEKLPFELFTGRTLDFDLNGPLQRLAGNDPTAVQKSCVLDATRELRIARREESDRKNQTAALSELSLTLQKLWRDTSKSSRDKRRAIFELWDECRDDAVGAEAREVIVRFIRKELPKGSAVAYTTSELAHFNRVRTAKEEFAPYS